MAGYLDSTALNFQLLPYNLLIDSHAKYLVIGPVQRSKGKSIHNE